VVAPQLFEPFDQRLIHFAIYAAFCFVMVVITFIDLDHKLTLNRVTVPSIAVFYAASLVWPERHWYDGVVGAAVGYGLPWAIGEIYYRVTHREGLGLGDGMLLALIGALLGWRGVLVSLFGGSVIGSVIGITALLIGRSVGADDAPEAAAEATPKADATPGDTPAPGEPAPAGGHAADGEAAGTELAGRAIAAGPEAEAEPEAEPESPSLMRTELPFGPFLAMAAVLYLFAEPWIQLHFHLPGG
jgi:leader peptidase (prepilin peptidase)/N-methyltransferase